MVGYCRNLCCGAYDGEVLWELMLWGFIWWGIVGTYVVGL